MSYETMMSRYEQACEGTWNVLSCVLSTATIELYKEAVLTLHRALYEIDKKLMLPYLNQMYAVYTWMSRYINVAVKLLIRVFTTLLTYKDYFHCPSSRDHSSTTSSEPMVSLRKAGKRAIHLILYTILH